MYVYILVCVQISSLFNKIAIKYSLNGNFLKLDYGNFQRQSESQQASAWAQKEIVQGGFHLAKSYLWKSLWSLLRELRGWRREKVVFRSVGTSTTERWLKCSIAKTNGNYSMLNINFHTLKEISSFTQKLRKSSSLCRSK